MALRVAQVAQLALLVLVLAEVEAQAEVLVVAAALVRQVRCPLRVAMPSQRPHRE